MRVPQCKGFRDRQGPIGELGVGRYHREPDPLACNRVQREQTLESSDADAGDHHVHAQDHKAPLRASESGTAGLGRAVARG